MTKRYLVALVPVAVATLMAGCEAKKSSNPLSPNIAGPIPGVEITAPKLLEPGQGWRFRDRDLPLTLLIENASSNGPRPLVYAFDVAIDAAFQNVVFSRRDVPEGPNGRTALPMQDRLELGRSYYWRAWAYDGANTSAVTSSVSFEVFPPVVIHPPTPVGPTNGGTAGVDAGLRVRNSARSGPAGNVRYLYQIARDIAFTQGVAFSNPPQPENVPAGETVWVPGNLQFNTTYYWRAHATDGEVNSSWSNAWVFTTSAAPAPGGGGSPVPPPPPGGGRTPDPAPGQKLPLPNMYGVVLEIATQYPAALRNSCQHGGGTWEFMDRVVNRLRQYDTRWGYNWKRGVVGDPSLDVVDYHWGPGADEGSTAVYIIDIITGHCGPDPQPGWADVTQVTLDSGTIGRWTGRGRF
jgi:hypothetical protein